MKLPGNALRIGITCCILAASALVSVSPTCRDETIVQHTNPLNRPLHILPESEIIEAYRTMGYVKACNSLHHLHDLFIETLNRSETPQFAYTASEVLRHAELIAKGCRNPYRLRYYQALLGNREAMRRAKSQPERKLSWISLLHDKKDASPKTAEMIREDIAYWERMGMDAFSGSSYEGLADYYFLIHEDEQALRCLTEGVARHIEGENITGLSHLYGRIGIYHLTKGTIAEAEKAFLESYEYARMNGDPYCLSRSLAFLSELRMKQGHFADAESLLVRSMDHIRKMNDPLAELYRQADLANLYFTLGQHDRAETAIEKAIALDWRQNGSAFPVYRMLDRKSAAYYLAKCLSLRAVIQLSRGQTNEAVETMKRALSNAQRSYDWSFEADLMKRLGDVHASNGAGREALRCYVRACSIARRRGDLGKEAEYLTAAGALCLVRKERSRAEEYLKRGAALAESPPFWMQRVRALHLLARAALDASERGEARQLLNESIAILERELAGGQSEERRRALDGLIRAIFSDLIVLDCDAPAGCDSLFAAAEKERQLLHGGNRIREKDFAANIDRCIVERGWIPEKTLIVQYVTTPQKLTIAAMDRSGATCRVVEIARERIEEEIGSFIAACGATGNPRAVPDESAPGSEIEERARSLYRLLVAPIGLLIEGNETICFILDDALRRLPFGALLQPGPNGRFLVESKRIIAGADLLSLRAAAEAQRSPGAERFESPLLVGRPDIGACLARNYPSIGELPSAQDEMIDIRDIIGGASILSGPRATKKNVLEALPTADLVHFATHRVTYPAHSGTSALLFSTGDDCDASHEVEASLLTEREIAGLNLSRVKLVILSACESAAGDERSASSGLGLAGAFIEGGSRQIVATVWPIEDQDAQYFITAFYRQLAETYADPHTALQRAQQRIIERNRANGNQVKEIRAWSPFIFIGAL